MENQQIEHKKAFRKDVIISLIAFANNEGGKVMGEVLEFEAREGITKVTAEKRDDIHEVLNYRKALRHTVTIITRDCWQFQRSEITVVDIPPGYTHSIENIGQGEMICLFWANQIFSPEMPDTYWEKVKK